MPLERLATSGSAETPGVAEECTNISVERRDAGSSTALLNIIYKYTLMEGSGDHWRITTRSVSIHQHRITILPRTKMKKLFVLIKRTFITALFLHIEKAAWIYYLVLVIYISGPDSMNIFDRTFVFENGIYGRFILVRFWV